MKAILFYFVLWVAGSYAVYSFLPSWCIVVYGVVSLVALLVYAVTRPTNLNNR